MKRLLLSTACAVAFSTPALAAPDVAGTMAASAVSTLVVSANRSAQPLDRIGQSVTVLSEAQIEASQAVSVADLLVQTPGVSVSRNGGLGQATSLRIRGAETDQTVVVIDGVKLNDPSQAGGGYNFGNLLTGDIARIEVLRGAQSTLWGSQAIGGVVNIVTAQPEAPFAANLEAEGGSMNTAYLRAGVGGTGQRVAWRLAASRFHTSGISSYAGGVEDDSYSNTGLSGRLNLKLAESVSLDLRSVYSRGRNEFDGFPPPTFSFGDTLEHGRTTDLVAYAGLNFGLLDGRLRNRIAYGYTRTDRANFNPDQAVTNVTFDARGENNRYEYQGLLDIARGWNATFGVEREDARMRSVSPSDFAPNPTPIRAEVSTNSAYAQLQGTVVDGLTLTGGLRREDHDTFGGKTLAQAAAAWSLNDGATVFRASFGQGFKAPTLYQLYSEYGNTSLSPEQADSWDAGVDQTLLDGRLRLQATWFGRKTTNQIDFVSCFSATTPAAQPLCYRSGVKRSGYYDNIARTKAEGVELSGAVRLGPFQVEGGYTWTEAVNDVKGGVTYGKFLARRPEHQGNVSIGWDWFGASSTVAVRVVGAAFDNAANTTRLGRYALVDLRTSYPITDKVSVYGRIENLTDEAYETTRNYGSPGRAAYAGLRAAF